MRNSYHLTIRTLLISFVLVVLHILAILFLLPEIYAQTPFWSVDLLLMTLTIAGVFLVSAKTEKKPQNFLKYYFVYTGLKVLSVLIFLSPWLLNKNELTRPMAYQTMLLFFLFLFVETYQLVRLLNK